MKRDADEGGSAAGQEASASSAASASVERLLMEGLGQHPLRMIAAVMGISVSTASRRLRALGLTRPQGGARPHPFEEKRRREIETLLRRRPGVSKVEVARLFGVSRQTVHRIAKGMSEKREKREKREKGRGGENNGEQ